MNFHRSIPTGTPLADSAELEELIRADYERSHPGDTLEALKVRAKFDKHDKGQFSLWLSVAATRRSAMFNGK